MFSEGVTPKPFVDTFVQGELRSKKALNPDVAEEVKRAIDRNLVFMPYIDPPNVKKDGSSKKLTRYSTGTTLRAQGKERTRRILSTVPMLTSDSNGRPVIQAYTPQRGTVFPELSGFGELAIGPHNLSEEAATGTNWWGGLTSILTTGANVYATVTANKAATQLALAQTKQRRTATQPAAGSGINYMPSTVSSIMSYLPWILAAGGGVVLLLLLTRGKKRR